MTPRRICATSPSTQVLLARASRMGLLALVGTLIAVVGASSAAAQPMRAAEERERLLLGPIEPLAEAVVPDEDVYRGQILLARDGDGATVFLQDDFDAPIVARARSRDESWSPPQPIPCERLLAARTFCSVAGGVVGDDGELIALLEVTSRRRNAVAVSVRRAGETTWSAPRVISKAYRVLTEWGPTIHANRRGAVLVTFGVLRRGGQEALIAAYRRPGQNWQSASYHRLRDVEYSQVSGLSRRGQAIVIYTPANGISAPVRTARFQPNQGWTDATRIGTGWSQNWSVAIGPGGRAIAAWLETDANPTGSSIIRQDVRVRQMSAGGRWNAPTVLARGSAASGSIQTWVRGESGVAWVNDNASDLIRAAVQPGGGQVWRTTPVARGQQAGPLRSIDLNGAGDLVLQWLTFTQEDGYGFGLALRPSGGQWTAPRVVSRDGFNPTSKDVLARRHNSALVAYRDDPREQVVARRAYTATR